MTPTRTATLTTRTTSRIVVQTLYVRIPPSIVRHPSFIVTSEYEIMIDAQGTITLTPITLDTDPQSRSSRETNP